MYLNGARVEHGGILGAVHRNQSGLIGCYAGLTGFLIYHQITPVINHYFELRHSKPIVIQPIANV